MDDLGDSRVASDIAKSWRQPGLNRAEAPILSTLMARYGDAATTFINDMLQTPDLSRPEAAAGSLQNSVSTCRIGSAPLRCRFLPHYRNAAQRVFSFRICTEAIRTRWDGLNSGCAI